MSFRDNPPQRRYELDMGGDIAWADYRQDGDRLVITHVEAPAALRGTGAAGQLMAAVVEDARAKQMRIVPQCGYAAAWLRRHPEHADLVAGGQPGPRPTNATAWPTPRE